MSSFWIVVPVKDTRHSKQRLMASLDADQRRSLALVMLEDVLAAIAPVGNLARCAVVTIDPEATSMAERYGMRVLTEGAGEGHTGSVSGAARLLGNEGASGFLTLPGDIPNIGTSEVEALLRAHRHAPAFTIAPSHDELGSNAVACSPVDAVPLRFGADSYFPHLATARRAGIEPTILRFPGIAMDIDTPEDLARFMRQEPRVPTRTLAYLEGLPGFGVTAAHGESGMTPAETAALLARVRDGHRLCPAEALSLADCTNIGALMQVAAALRDEGHGDLVSYSRKVFIPLTKLCRDSCHYCTFAIPPRTGEKAYLTPDEVVAIAERGRQAGCHEALFTLGDKPELRYRSVREELDSLGAASTLDYLAQMAKLVLDRTGLLPHVNPGVMTAEDIARLRTVSISQGIMLETASERLSARGGPHFGSPDKLPALRLLTIEDAGKLAVPFTSGILIGIGETRAERIEALLALRDLHDRYGHLQEIIIQNFRAKPGTRMASADEPSLDEHLWTIAVARLLFEPAMNIQAPPNLGSGSLSRLIAAGINDWGGVSPVTPDHVNPEAPWPELVALEQQTAEAGKQLVQRLAIYPAYARDPDRWVGALNTRLNTLIDATAFGRDDTWRAGTATGIPAPAVAPRIVRNGGDKLGGSLDRAREGRRLGEADVVSLFAARGENVARVTAAADEIRRITSGDTVTYVVNRNINYTNVCYFKCQFCAFSKGKLSENLRGLPYVLDLDEIERRTLEAWDRGATEVCLQGGIHPDYTGTTYLEICRRIKLVRPGMHIHAFSPLEIWQGAATLKMPVAEYLAELKAAGLSSLPGTAAEILDDEVRAIICPDKITTAQWLEVMEFAHGVGLRSTATIMFGHVDLPYHWARHLLRVRDLQERTGGFTEFVPLPFVPTEAPIYLKGRARPGPTYREAVLMHAVARLVLHPLITNIQASWVKMGREGVAACLQSGVNDIGGTLMNESITRAAGAVHGQEMPPEAMHELIRSLGRTPRQRTTLYDTPDAERTERSFHAPALLPAVQTPAKSFMRERTRHARQRL